MISTRDVRFDIAAPSGGVRQQAYLHLARRDAAVEALIAAEEGAAVNAALNQYIVADAECLRGIKAGDQSKAIPADQRDAINEQIASRTMVVEGQMLCADFMAQYAPYAKALFFLQSPINGGSAMAYRLTYEALRKELIEPAITGDGVTAPTPVSASASIDNLMATLEASLEQAKAGA